MSEPISIQGAPSQYRPFLEAGDKKGNGNGIIDSDKEARETLNSCTIDCGNLKTYLEAYQFQLAQLGIRAPSKEEELEGESSQEIEVSLAKVEELETKIKKNTDKLRTYAYRQVVARLIDKYNNADPIDLYCLFYYYDSERRTQAINNLKALGVYDAVENNRARFLMQEILKKSFDDTTNLQLLRLTDATRFKNSGRLWETALGRMEETNAFEGRAKKIIAEPEVGDNLSVLSQLNHEDMALIFNYIGEPDYYFIPWVITDAGEYAARRLHAAIIGEILLTPDFINLHGDFLTDTNIPEIKEISLVAIDYYADNDPQIIPNNMIPLLIGIFDIEKYSVYDEIGIYAARILAKIGSRSIPYLKEALNSSDWAIRAGAAKAVSQITYKSPQIIPDDMIPLLVKNLNNNEEKDIMHYEEISISHALDNLGSRSIPYLREALNSPDEEIRARAGYVVDKIAYKNPQLIPDDMLPLLINNLGAAALANMGTRFIPYLKEALCSSDEKTRAKAANVLINIADDDPQMIPDDVLPLLGTNLDVLIEYLNVSDNLDLLDHIAYALANLSSRFIPYLIEAFSSSNEKIRAVALLTIGNIADKNPQMIPDNMMSLLVKELNSNEKDYYAFVGKKAVTETLVNIGLRAMPYLKEMLDSPDEKIRANAIHVMRGIADKNPQMIPDDMIPLLIKNLDIVWDENVAYALANLGSRSIPYLKEALSRPDEKIRANAIHVMRGIADKSPQMIPDDMIPLLIKNLAISEHASWSLVGIGLRAVPFLKEMLDSPDEKIRARAALTIIRIACMNPQIISDDIMPSLVKNLDIIWDENVAYALANLGSRSIPYLKEALSRPDEKIRANAAFAVDIIADKNPQMIPDDMIPLLINSLDVPQSAAYALANIGSRSIPYLKEALSSPNGKIRAGAASAVVFITCNDPQIIPNDLIPFLVKNLDNDEMYYYSSGSDYATIALTKIGSRAIPYLKEALVDSNQNIANRAEELLLEIEESNLHTN